jgi:peptidoglycan-associated lipoprotein
MGGYLEPMASTLGQSSRSPSGGVGETEALPPEILALLTDLHFDFDSYALSREAQEQLGGLGIFLRDHPELALLIEGHCDERGDAAYNLALGEKRALTVREFLAGMGVASARLMTVSFGEERPLDPGYEEAAWARNRRAHFRLRGR